MLAHASRSVEAALVVVASATTIDGARAFRALAVVASGLTVLTVGTLLLDDRMLGDEPAWLKPFKFAVSFAVLFATLAFAVGRLSDTWRRSRAIIVGVALAGAAFFFEMAYIVAQAARLEASHFNDSTPFHATMYAMMGQGATALMVTIAIVGLVVLADRTARVGQGLRLGVVLGFSLTAVLTTWVAGELAGNGGRYVGAPSDLHERLPLVGWSMEVGDLRPAHFLALHAMQVLPLAGYLADRLGARARLVWMAAVLYAMFTTMLFHQALGGRPLISA